MNKKIIYTLLFGLFTTNILAQSETCVKPVISYSNGVITCTTSTPDAICHISYSYNGEGVGENSVKITPKLVVTAYATKEGFSDSEVAKQSFDIINNLGDVNKDGVISMADANNIVNIFLNGSGENANRNEVAEAQLLEIPHLNPQMVYAPHYVEYEGKKIMNLAVEWDSSIRHSTWVAFRWDSTTSQDNVSRGDSWKWDPVIAKDKGSVAEADHKSDGYDKGHLCASEDRVYSKEANDQTFYYSNISPQIASFNQQYWARLEGLLQSWGKMTQTGEYDTVYVVKGGTTKELLCNYTGAKKANDGLLPTTDENGYSVKGLPVPAYYYMAVLTVKDGQYHAIAFLVPHQEGLPSSPTLEEYQQFVVSIDELEEKTSIDFFCNLPDYIEVEIEKTVKLESWKW